MSLGDALDRVRAWLRRRDVLRQTVVFSIAVIGFGAPGGAYAQQSASQSSWLVFAGPEQLAVPENGAAPSGVAVDDQGAVYVTIPTLAIVEKFGPDGTRLAVWGPVGGGPSEPPRAIGGLTLDAQGNIYVAATINEHIAKLSPNGEQLTLWGAYGNKAGSFATLTHVAVDGGGNIYAADASNDRIQKFGPNGAFLALWGLIGSDANPIAGGPFGVGGPYRLDDPEGVAVDSEGNFFVADTKNHRIQKLSPGAQPIAQWPTRRASPGQLYGPTDVVLDRQGNLYVADTPLQKLSPGGEQLPLPALPGPLPTATVAGVAVDARGNLYVTTADRVLKLPAGDQSQAPQPDLTSRAPGPVLARVVQRADGSLYLVAGTGAWALVPDPITDEVLASLVLSEPLLGAINVNQAGQAQLVQGADGTLYLVQGQQGAALVPDALSDDAWSALTVSGELDGAIPRELLGPSVP